MNTIVSIAPATEVPRSFVLRSYLLEAKYEFLRLLRMPAFAVPTLMFPAMFYLLFGVMFGQGSRSYQAGTYLQVSFGVLGVMAPGLFGFGASVASERERGWLTLKRALPMPPGAYLVAKLVMAVLFALAVFAILALLGVMLGGVRLAPAQWLGLLLTDALGVLPFCAIGLWIGTLAGAQAAPALINLIYLPMAFLSGLWIPLFALPGVIQRIAAALPAYHLAQIGYTATGQPHRGSVAVHALVLLAFAAVFFALARRRLALAP